MLKYRAKEERWQNLIGTDLQYYDTHFLLFGCLMSAKYCTIFILYPSFENRSQTQRKLRVKM